MGRSGARVKSSLQRAKPPRPDHRYGNNHRRSALHILWQNRQQEMLYPESFVDAPVHDPKRLEPPVRTGTVNAASPLPGRACGESTRKELNLCCLAGPGEMARG